MRIRSIVVVVALGLLAGCGPKGEVVPDPAPPPAPQNSAPTTPQANAPAAPGANAPVAEAPGGEVAAPQKPGAKSPTPSETAKLMSFPVDRGAEISVALPKQSLAVVEYYDRALAGRGWKKREAKSDEDPGHREWIEMPVPAGPTDLYDAAWTDPKTGRTAVLNLFHTKEAPEIQQGNFEIHAKGQAPWKQ